MPAGKGEILKGKVQDMGMAITAAVLSQGRVALRWVCKEVAQEVVQEAMMAGLMLVLPF